MRQLLMLIGILLFLNACNQKYNKLANSNTEGELERYKKFCFDDNTCTEYILFQTVTKSNSKGEVKKEFIDVKIPKISLQKSSDKKIITQFLLSLEAFNLYSAKKTTKNIITFSNKLFWEGDSFQKEYFQKFDKNNFIKILNLNSLNIYDFKRKTFTKIIDDNTVEITFEGNDTKIICSKEYYDNTLFPKYINFISNTPRLTGYNIKMKKIKL